MHEARTHVTPSNEKSQWLCVQKPKETWCQVKEAWEKHKILQSRQPEPFSCSIAHVRQAWLRSLVSSSVKPASKQQVYDDDGGDSVSVGHG